MTIPKKRDWVTCEDCGRLLWEKDGPICPECVHDRRSEAARKGAETRKENEGASGKADAKEKETAPPPSGDDTVDRSTPEE